jgi:hypothetical protein
MILGRMLTDDQVAELSEHLQEYMDKFFIV